MLLVFGGFVSLGSETIVEEVLDCAQYCVSDIHVCVFSSIIYKANRNAYISDGDYTNCELNLESCIDYCSP